MQKKITILKIIILIIGVAGIFITLQIKNNQDPIEVNKEFDNIDLDRATNLMFVAHPDDDSIWGGKHLLDDGEKYLVVCITCGVRKDRALEFESAMKKTNSQFLMLGWPDKTNGEKDNWDTSKDGIRKDIEKILALKDWNLVVTHNPEGEYGHIHHIMTNNMVTDLANKDRLMYFGKYYKKTDLDDYKDKMVELDYNDLEDKKDLISIYKTQDFVFDMFGHMFPYEEWLSYEDWNNEG